MPQILLNDKNLILNKINFLTGNADKLFSINSLPAKEPFNDEIINFLNDLSQELILNREAKNFSDVITFAFWVRKTSVLKIKSRFLNLNLNLKNDKSAFYLGKGVVFHIAPSNVPVNFAFSLVTGLLTGNANIVKIPSKNFHQVNLIVDAINKILGYDKHANLRNYIFLIKYERDRDINDFLSSLTDIRVIWGGDDTINEIRKSPLAPRSGEITFADRYSIALIDSDFYFNLDDKAKNKIAQDFYNDTFFSDQNACTSPRMIIWTGNKISDAKRDFWNYEHELVKNKYNFQDIQAVNKLTSFYMLAACKSGVKLIKNGDNLIVRAQVQNISGDLMNFRDNSGYFIEYDCKDIFEIKNLINDKKCQTVAYLGSYEDIINLVKTGIKGVDRIVPFGKTMDFDLIWDGYNLFSQLTRTVKIEV